jgi:Leucine-rich repeat (LRR) protein
VAPLITRFINLTYINLNHNRLTSLSQTFGELRKLQRLSVKDNLLESLPTSLSKCSQLTLIDCRFNPFSTKPNPPDSDLYFVICLFSFIVTISFLMYSSISL